MSPAVTRAGCTAGPGDVRFTGTSLYHAIQGPHGVGRLCHSLRGSPPTVPQCQGVVRLDDVSRRHVESSATTQGSRAGVSHSIHCKQAYITHHIMYM